MAITYLSGQRIQGQLQVSPKCATFAGGYAGTMGSLMSGTGDWSVSIWGYATGGIINNFGLFSSNGTAELMVYQGGNQRILASSGGTAIGSTDDSEDIAQDTWFHAVYTRESGAGKLYLQGELVATGTDTTDMPSGTEWRVGHANSSEVWTGSQIEFAVWNDRVLSLAEVQKIYNSGVPKRLADAGLTTAYTENLTGYYPMDTNFDNAYSAGGGTNGVISGSATVGNSSPATPIPVTNDKTTVTDVPVGSEFEQTDDYKTYQRSGAGATYATTTYTNDDADDAGSNLKIYGTGRLANASRVVSGGALDGFTMSQFTVKIQKVGSPASSTIYGRIWNTASESLVIVATSSDTFNTDDISTSAPYTNCTFTFPNTVLLANYKIGIFAEISGGTSSNAIVMRANDTTADNADVVANEYNPTEYWNDDLPKNMWQYFSKPAGWVERGTAI